MDDGRLYQSGEGARDFILSWKKTLLNSCDFTHNSLLIISFRIRFLNVLQISLRGWKSFAHFWRVTVEPLPCLPW